VFSAIEKQLGLKLVQQSVQAPVLMVDSVSEQPAPAAAALKKNPLPMIPTQFEVASIKLSPPDATQSSYRVLPGGRFTMDNVTLQQLIMFAWDLDDDSLIAGGPKWLDSTRYTLNADASTAIAGSREVTAVDMGDVRLMLRALLEQSLKLKTHVEQRPVSAYTLVVDKPRLQPANASDRTRCKDGVVADGRDPRAANDQSSRVFSCQNVTMAEFAERLSSLAPGYLHLPVEDGTGLNGSWTFSFFFASIAQVAAARRAANPDGSNAQSADEPIDALTLFEALPKQLGLKLENRKRPMPVVVIDHVEQTPVE
jgi:uncharacterized protein (TIGR03435 family)